MPHPQKVIVIGAGIGGLTTAALLAKAGLDVTVLEANTYPGGSAGTFTHKGYRFDAGATVAGGFQPNGPHTILANQLGITWPVQPSDVAWVVHLPQRSITFSRDMTDMLTQFPQSTSFWKAQQAVANLTWSMAAQGLPWPPASQAELWQVLRAGLSHAPGVVRLLPLIFSKTHHWMRRFGLAGDPEFVRLLDAQLLISAQTTTQHANALYSATALDLARQGTYHVKGGMGGIAQTLVDTLTESGGRVLYRKQVRRIAVQDGRATGVYVQTGKRDSQQTFMPADLMVANLTPDSLARLLGENPPPQQDGWGAFVLHLGVEANKLPPTMPDHHQIVTTMTGPLGEGCSIFVSFSPTWDNGRAPAGHRAVTITTHTHVQPWWDLLATDPDAYNARKQAYTDHIITAIDKRIPNFRDSIKLQLAGTPVTYAYYTGRDRGLVGGFPQTSLFKAKGPRTTIPNLRLVGDSIFPGQSTAGVTLGAIRTARDILNSEQLRTSGRMTLQTKEKAQP